MSTSAPVNVVLVHNDFVDGSGCHGVYDVLKQDGYNVSVVQNPTLSLEGDVAATREIIDAQDGPVVLVAGRPQISDRYCPLRGLGDPLDDEFAPGLQAYFATAGRLGNQSFAQLLFKDGPQQAAGIETDLGTAIGKLRQNS